MNNEKQALVPRLRFPEFQGAGVWHELEFNEVINKTSNGLNLDQNDNSSGVKVTRIETISSNKIDLEKIGFVETDQDISRYRLSVGDILFSNINSLAHIGRSVLIDKDYDLYHGMNLLRFEVNQSVNDSRFIFYLLNTENIRSSFKLRANKAVNQASINQTEVGRTSVILPKIDEQQKIADCLTSLDALIAVQAEKHNVLKKYKKGLMQQLFPRENETTPRLRFPEFRGAGEWQEVPLKELANRCIEKNRNGKLTRVLTNSAEHGVVDQRDYFDKDIAVQGNLEGYFIVKKGDYVYNPRISTMAPVGPISRNNIATGVMSPLYTVFRFKNEDSDFYAHYFKTASWHEYMRSVSSTGARHDRMAINKDDFISMPLPVAPLAEEQIKIADYLSTLDALITAQGEKVDALKAHKKGLMQQLFPRPETMGV